jgi:hypothetical protein
MAPSLMFLGVDLATVNWYLIIYILFAIASVFMGVTKLYPMGAPTAIIYAIGVTMVLIFYGYRWFGEGSNTTPSTWPPTINTCPDYFTYIQSLPGDSLPGCVDMLGVSKNGSIQLTTDTVLSTLSSTSVSNVFPFTSSDVLNAKQASVIQGICNLCNQKGITWEGVYDGDSCTGVSNNATALAAKSQTCPM